MFNTGKFARKTIVITGASRGIGKEIALKLAKDGANIVIAAKTAEAHPKLPGTIYSAAEEIEKAGGKALPCIVDVRDEQAVQECVDSAVNKFGGIDVLVNNASAISLTGTLDTQMKRYDLMHNINTRGTFLMSQKCIPYLKQAKNPHILNLSPPLLMEPKWFSNHVAYTMAKYGMSMCVLGMHEEFRSDGIAVNALWPKTAIWTAAMDMLSGGSGAAGSRKPDIVADAAYVILSRNSRDFTGNFAIDEDILKEEGVTDFAKYAVDPSAPLIMDFFIPGAEHHVGNLGDNPKRQKSRASLEVADVAATLSKVKSIITPEHVKKIGAVFEFTLKGANGTNHAFLDLKNGSGTAGEGKPSKADVFMESSLETFLAIFSGELSASKAFMTQQLKIKGDMSKAIQLESLLKNLQKSKL